MRDVERVAAAGFKEIILTGVHLGSYGRDLGRATSLGDLLRELARWAAARTFTSELLFRISSLEPMDCTPEVVALVAEHCVFAPHFHLPLQHASNRMLRAMRRPYTIEYYASLVAGIRARMPDAAIGTDVIVGFPGEADEDFDRLASYLASSPLTHVHVFPYSDRPGTAAAEMSGRVSGARVRERARRVREISSELTKAFHRSQRGRVHRGLTLDDGSMVVTDNYLKVRVDWGLPRNQRVRVKITDVDHVVRGSICGQANQGLASATASCCAGDLRDPSTMS
jgi:threonylcarbamoyladenosine tRNA methylthiotransferase MtaB